MPESHLLGQGWMQDDDISPYAKQMALKLLVAQAIETEYYLTLDADVLALRHMDYDDVIMGHKALYINER